MKNLNPRKSLEKVPLYTEEHHLPVNLADNTNVWGANPAVARAIASFDPESVHRYPSLLSQSLRGDLAERLGVPAEGIVTGNGSNELIDLLMRAFLDPGDTLAYHWPTFSMVPIFGGQAGATLAPVPLQPWWKLDVPALLAAEGKITFVCRPNNPTGNAFPRADVERVIEEAPGIVVVDEAYVEFCGGSFVEDLHRYDNLIVLRTFSKAYGLAAFRIGYAATSPKLAQAITKVRAPYRLNALSERVAVEALREEGWLQWVVEEVNRERPRLISALTSRGFKVFPSDANFVLAVPPVDPLALTKALHGKGIAIREFKGDLSPYLRITVAPPPVRDRLLTAIDECLKAGVGQ
ncbi:MAG TPA: histidinol-phosphate transaminase [Candidatus Thermoplasmatota archaeon]|nr:histidinol-phosphate transaminase [Candidatus Thermoplasmatota archaeon]